jgi:hypothetical protein
MNKVKLLDIKQQSINQSYSMAGVTEIGKLTAILVSLWKRGEIIDINQRKWPPNTPWYQSEYQICKL